VEEGEDANGSSPSTSSASEKEGADESCTGSTGEEGEEERRKKQKANARRTGRGSPTKIGRKERREGRSFNDEEERSSSHPSSAEEGSEEYRENKKRVRKNQQSNSSNAVLSSSGAPGGGDGVRKSDDTTWSEKIDHVLRQHDGGEGTSEEICNWIGEAFPQAIEGKANWRRTISARLSAHPGFVKGPPRPGERAAVWTLLGRQVAKGPPASASSLILRRIKKGRQTGSSDEESHNNEEAREATSSSSSRKGKRKDEDTNPRGADGEAAPRKKQKCSSARTNWNLTADKIAKAMTDHGGGKGKLFEICEWVQKDFPEDLVGVSNWKNRISNYLSNNTLFEKSNDDYPAVWSISEGASERQRGMGSESEKPQTLKQTKGKEKGIKMIGERRAFAFYGKETHTSSPLHSPPNH